jgi:hypothetical protein
MEDLQLFDRKAFVESLFQTKAWSSTRRKQRNTLRLHALLSHIRGILTILSH